MTANAATDQQNSATALADLVWKTIKPLCWYRDEEDDWRADTPICDFVVMRLERGKWAAEMWHGPMKTGETVHLLRSTVKDCKAACEKKWKEIVGSLLTS